MFDRLSSQHSLTSQRTYIEPNLKCSLEQEGLELSTFKRHIANLEARSKRVAEKYLAESQSPFTEDIFVEPLPEKLKIPQLTSYEWEGDLLSHIDKYTSRMELQGVSDAIMCPAMLSP